jgi:hypothetical protein
MQPPRQDRLLPSRWGYLVAAFLIALAVAGVPGLVTWFVMGQPSPKSFLAPGPLEFVAKEPGKHTLWHEYDTIFNGVTYSSNMLPSGLQFLCVDAKSGVALPFGSDRGAHMSTSNVRRESVAAVQIPAPGRYLIRVEGAAQPVLFSFGPAILAKTLGSIFGAIPVAFALFAGGVALAIRVFVRRNRAQQAA